MAPADTQEDTRREPRGALGFVLTCVAVSKGVEVSWDVPPPEQTHHLRLHVPIGGLEVESQQLQAGLLQSPGIGTSVRAARWGVISHRYEPGLRNIYISFNSVILGLSVKRTENSLIVSTGARHI